LGLSVTAGTKVLSVTRQALNHIVNGRSGISPEMAIRLTKAFGSTPEIKVRRQHRLRQKGLVGMSLQRMFHIVCLCTLVCASTFSQTIAGSIFGTITDPANAAMPGVAVQLTDTATGAFRSAVSNDSGLFRFINLEPATYNLSVKAQGFKTHLETSIEFSASETRDLGRISLALGRQSDAVTVTAGRTPVQVASGEIPASRIDPTGLAMFKK